MNNTKYIIMIYKSAVVQIKENKGSNIKHNFKKREKIVEEITCSLCTKSSFKQNHIEWKSSQYYH